VLRDRRKLALALAVWSAAALLRSLAVLPARSAAEARPGREPWLWRRTGHEVVAIERFLASVRPELPRGAGVLVVADCGAGVEASFVWHWAQYFEPAPNFVWTGDVGADFAAERVLAWGPVVPRPGWTLLARDGEAALYRAARPAPAPPPGAR
jgi:hypothetical protein